MKPDNKEANGIDANENNAGKNNEQNQEQSSWLDSALERIDREFPLSGAVDDKDIVIDLDTDAEDMVSKKQLNTNFPLSGGAAEE